MTRKSNPGHGTDGPAPEGSHRRRSRIGLANGSPRGIPTDRQLLDEAPIGAFHRRVVLMSGVGFFTDAYDLFVISTVAVLVPPSGT